MTTTQTFEFTRTLAREHDAGQHTPGQYETCPRCSAARIQTVAALRAAQ